MTKTSLLLFLLLLGLCAPLLAQPAPTLSTDRESPYVSEKVAVTLDLGKIDRFSGLKVDTGNTGGFILVIPDLTENNSISDNIGIVTRGPTFQFLLYPQRSGKLRVGPFALSYEIPPSLGRAARSVRARTNALTLDVRMPPGAPDGAFVLVTSKMTAETAYTPDVAQMKVGDVLQRTIIITALNVPDVLIPAVKTEKPAEFNVYPNDPLLTQTPSATDSSVITARRVQKESFVAISAGEADIPAQKLYWYDGKQLHTITIAGKNIMVEGVPVSHGAPQGRRVRYLVAILVLLSVLTSAGVFAYKRYLKTRFTARRDRYIHSEPGRFADLQSAVKDGGVTDVYAAFYRWANVAMTDTEALDFGVIVARYPQAEAPLALLEKPLQAGTDFDRTQLMTGLLDLREAVTRTRRKHPYNLIHSMNPV